MFEMSTEHFWSCDFQAVALTARPQKFSSPVVASLICFHLKGHLTDDISASCRLSCSSHLTEVGHRQNVDRPFSDSALQTVDLTDIAAAITPRCHQRRDKEQTFARPSAEADYSQQSCLWWVNSWHDIIPEEMSCHTQPYIWIHCLTPFLSFGEDTNMNQAQRMNAFPLKGLKS